MANHTDDIDYIEIYPVKVTTDYEEITVIHSIIFNKLLYEIMTRDQQSFIITFHFGSQVVFTYNPITLRFSSDSVTVDKDQNTINTALNIINEMLDYDQNKCISLKSYNNKPMASVEICV